MPEQDFELRVNQSRYSGWKSLSLTRSMEQLAHSFNVSLTDRWVDDAKPIPVEAGDECVVLIDDEVIVTGYIDEDSLTYDSKTRSLSLSGRSKTGDLIDCAAVHKGGQWRDTGLLKIAQDLCRPFGITASTKIGIGRKFTKPDTFKLQEGETAFDALSRGARARGVLMMTDANGNLVFDRAGATRVTTVLERGKNIIRGSKRNSWSDRFKTLTVKAQSAGNDETSGSATSLKRVCTDNSINRYRPTIILGDTESSSTELHKRAHWECNVRTGRSRRLSYTVQGWSHLGGLWAPNTLIRVIDTDARVDDELLAVSVTQSRSAQGTTTTIDLTLKEAFGVEPLPATKRKSGSLYP